MNRTPAEGFFLQRHSDFENLGTFDGDEGDGIDQIFMNLLDFQNFDIGHFFIAEGACWILFPVMIEMFSNHGNCFVAVWYPAAAGGGDEDRRQD